MNKKVTGFILISIAIMASVTLMQGNTDQTSAPPLSTAKINPDTLPLIRSTSNMVHLKSLEKSLTNDTFEYNKQIINIVNGYPSPKSIVKLAELKEGSFIIDAKSEDSVMIKNGDCMILYTQAKPGFPPEIVDLFNNCE